MLKKIVIIGPESTGKSTLSQDLSERFGEPWVPEFAREYLEQLGRPYAYADLLAIAQGQVNSEESLMLYATDYLFCDTDLHVVKVWSEHKYGKVDPWIDETIRRRQYDGYILTAIDMPWQPDPQREHPEPAMREYFYTKYLDLVEKTGVPFISVSGSREQRLSVATDWLESFR